MRLLKRTAASRPFQKTVGVLTAEYLRLVWKTNRLVIEPADFYEPVRNCRSSWRCGTDSIS
jgi:hypothetical protein